MGIQASLSRNSRQAFCLVRRGLSEVPRTIQPALASNVFQLVCFGVNSNETRGNAPLETTVAMDEDTRAAALRLSNAASSRDCQPTTGGHLAMSLSVVLKVVGSDLAWGFPDPLH